jgi:hypothetical protein
MKRPSKRHPAYRAIHPPPEAGHVWHCVICTQDGIGGARAFTTHYIEHHYTPGETSA